MRWSERRILLTGASGGIGRELSAQLAAHGARLLLVGRDKSPLAPLQASAPDRIQVLGADLTHSEDRQRVVNAADQAGIDMLINAAGINHFGLFDEQSAERLTAMIDLNISATLLLTQALLPRLLHRPAAWVVNVGSAFGAIGHPGYTAYCASKFALRGFSQALRRELADTPVQVLYLAPRATRTAMNSASADAMNTALGNRVDEPEDVAAAVIRGIETSARERQIGWPECLLVKLNALAPGLVDRALKKRLPLIQRHARDLSSSP
ncbi:SDR family oxidoreductase [Salinicola avicenniae]|uniref:SDR family oxidoreductase n=1 Tax=Salinicola avicenniae TaxID=2916836 RepID=UPI00207311BE|nr:MULTISPECIES: SDR family oxidoreductase [unclassified Salinicola]